MVLKTYALIIKQEFDLNIIVQMLMYDILFAVKQITVIVYVFFMFFL